MGATAQQIGSLPVFQYGATGVQRLMLKIPHRNDTALPLREHRYTRFFW